MAYRYAARPDDEWWTLDEALLWCVFRNRAPADLLGSPPEVLIVELGADGYRRLCNDILVALRSGHLRAYAVAPGSAESADIAPKDFRSTVISERAPGRHVVARTDIPNCPDGQQTSREAAGFGSHYAGLRLSAEDMAEIFPANDEPMSIPTWTLVMALTWLTFRSAAHVQKQVSSWRMSAGLPAAQLGVLWEDGARPDVMDEDDQVHHFDGRRAFQTFSRLCQDRKLNATGFSNLQQRPVELTPQEWAYGSMDFKERGTDYVFRVGREGFTDITVSRDDLLAILPPSQTTTAGIAAVTEGCAATSVQQKQRRPRRPTAPQSAVMSWHAEVSGDTTSLSDQRIADEVSQWASREENRDKHQLGRAPVINKKTVIRLRKKGILP